MPSRLDQHDLLAVAGKRHDAGHEALAFAAITCPNVVSEPGQ